MSEDTGTATQRTDGTESDATSGGERRRALRAERDRRHSIGREDLPPPPSLFVRPYAHTTVRTGSIPLPVEAQPAVGGIAFPAPAVSRFPDVEVETASESSDSVSDPTDPADDQPEPTPETDAELPVTDEPETAPAVPSHPEPPAPAPHMAPPGRSLFEPVVQPERLAFDDVPFSAPPLPVEEPALPEPEPEPEPSLEAHEPQPLPTDDWNGRSPRGDDGNAAWLRDLRDEQENAASEDDTADDPDVDEPEPPQPAEPVAAWEVQAADGARAEALQDDRFAHDISTLGPSTPRPFQRTPAERLTRALGDEHPATAAGHGNQPGDGPDAVDDEPVRGTLEPVLRHATERARYSSATPPIRPPDVAFAGGALRMRPAPLTWDEALGMTVVPERGRRRRFAKPRHESGGPAEYRPKGAPDRSLTLLVVGMLLVLAVLVGLAVWFIWASAGGTPSLLRGAVLRGVAVRAP